MAAPYYHISGTRPCYVATKRRHSVWVDFKKAMFHQWFQYTTSTARGVDTGICGIVEFEDGSIDFVTPKRIRFADGGKFNDVVWLTEEFLNKIADNGD